MLRAISSLHGIIMTYFYVMRGSRSAPWQPLCVSLLFGLLLVCNARVHKGTSHCEYYNRKKCFDGTGPCQPTIQDCSNMTSPNKVTVDKPDNYMLCYATWDLSSNSSKEEVIMKGCWLNQDECIRESRCVEKRQMSALLFCCCDGNMCNNKVYYEPQNEPERGRNPKQEDEEPDGDVVRRVGDYQRTKTILFSIVPILCSVILIVGIFFIWRRHQRHPGHEQLPTVDPNLAQTPSQTSLSVQLIELKAKGRFGYVWKAQLMEQYVAVKIFPLADKKSWMTELDIYNLPKMKHDNVLLFIASEKKEEGTVTDLWLITEFHEKGSLYDFLKANTITWAQLCKIGETMTCGLTYLHEEILASNNYISKPAIAHRDFKSKNVLVKSDLTACIADFGLALKFEAGNGQNEIHTQVGTRRYMAPEVLEGAICFNMDSFLRIDMYACSLVVWELMSRCSCIDGSLEEYRLPFEAEVGLQPSLGDMQMLVVSQKRRPGINALWMKHQGLLSLVSTVEECWDHDAEARLSAGCVHDRLVQLSLTKNAGGNGTYGDAPPRILNSVISPAPVMNSPTLAPPYVPNPAVIDPNGNRELSSYSLLPRNLGTC